MQNGVGPPAPNLDHAYPLNFVHDEDRSARAGGSAFALVAGLGGLTVAGSYSQRTRAFRYGSPMEPLDNHGTEIIFCFGAIPLEQRNEQRPSEDRRR